MDDRSHATHRTTSPTRALRTRQELTRALHPGPPALIAAVTQLLHRNPHTRPDTLLPLLHRAHHTRAGGPQPMPPWEAALLLQAITDRHVRDACTGWHDQAATRLWGDLISTAPPEWIAPVATLTAITAYQRHDLELAGLAAQHALADRPTYHLAHLIQMLLWAAVPPAQVQALITQAQHRPPQTPNPDPDTTPSSAQHGHRTLTLADPNLLGERTTR